MECVMKLNSKIKMQFPPNPFIPALQSDGGLTTISIKKMMYNAFGA